MTPENVYQYAKSYKLYFAGDFDFVKYGGRIRNLSPLIQQKDRRFYHKLSQKLNDSEIHMTLLAANFFKPNIYIADICEMGRMDEGVQLASRFMNGLPLTTHTLHDLRKMLRQVDLDDWLYGEKIGDRRAAMPEAMGMVIAKEIPLDVACLLFLVPQRHLGFDWAAHWDASEAPDAAFGVRPWLTRLRKADQLFHMQWPGYRRLSAAYVRGFWDSFGRTLDPLSTQPTLMT